MVKDLADNDNDNADKELQYESANQTKPIKAAGNNTSSLCLDYLFASDKFWQMTCNFFSLQVAGAWKLRLVYAGKTYAGSVRLSTCQSVLLATRRLAPNVEQAVVTGVRLIAFEQSASS